MDARDGKRFNGPAPMLSGSAWLAAIVLNSVRPLVPRTFLG